VLPSSTENMQSPCINTSYPLGWKLYLQLLVKVPKGIFSRAVPSFGRFPSNRICVIGGDKYNFLNRIFRMIVNFFVNKVVIYSK